MTTQQPQDEFELSLVATDGSRLPCIVRVDDSSDAVTLEYAGAKHEEEDECYFDAFCRIREQLAENGLMPICYGASRNVYPSGMSRQMGGGIKAYKLTLAKQARTVDLVHIFETGPDVVPVSVAEQREFFERWLKSL